MFTRNGLFTAESVSPGHPDKLCDQISDAVLDFILTKEPLAKAAIECFATTNYLLIGGEINTSCEINNQDIELLARNVIKEIGYAQDGFNWQDVKINILIHKQSPDIAKCVIKGDEKLLGAGDQGIMFGYATDETEDFMPATIYYCNRLLENIWNDIKNGSLKNFGPDGKTQITFKYKNDEIIGVEKVILSMQHSKDLSLTDVRNILMPMVLKSLPKGIECDEKNVLINASGNFIIGGPDGDAGLTGRKIIIDAYGAGYPHGGGAFSGKDPSKVDRSAAYMARYIAKNLVSKKVCRKALVQVAYCIGIAEPMCLQIDTFDNLRSDVEEIKQHIKNNIAFTPHNIIQTLKLNNPIYQPTASFGHFGREAKNGLFTWEKCDLEF